MSEIKDIFEYAINSGSLKKAVLSRPYDKDILRSCVTLFKKGDGVFVQLESFTSDNKAYHRNIPAADAAGELEELALHSYRQTDIITKSGNCEIKIPKSGKPYIYDKIKRESGNYEIGGHDRVKRLPLDTVRAAEFLFRLGLSDEKGRVFDRKRSKYDQINKFIMQVETVYRYLPAEGEIRIMDLCCGKSYLTFALYFYLHVLKGRQVNICGVDLKRDCIDYCTSVAKELGFDGLSFICADILEYEPEVKPDMAVSLHACDIATDIAIAKAVRCGAPVILSTPCCHHEMFHRIDCKELDFINKYSMLKQKLCDAATDALRAQALEICGYKTEIVEFIDAEETPKNLLIRAVYRGVPDDREKMLGQYRANCGFLKVEPYLAKLLF